MSTIELVVHGEQVIVSQYEDAVRIYKNYGFVGYMASGLKGSPETVDPTLFQQYFLSIEEAAYLIQLYPNDFQLPTDSMNQFHRTCIDMSFRVSAYFYLKEIGASLLEEVTEQTLCPINGANNTIVLNPAIKNGSKYGVDFLVYSGEPGKVHSSFGVLLAENSLDWRFIISACRVMDQVKKSLFIISRSDMVAVKEDSLDGFSTRQPVSGYFISRWLPN
jgi:tRNA intron endonuclease, catalytic C-terminal domain